MARFVRSELAADICHCALNLLEKLVAVREELDVFRLAVGGARHLDKLEEATRGLSSGLSTNGYG